MTDIMTLISTTLAGIDSAIGIAKAVKDADSSVQLASYKLQLADLMMALADSKINIAEIKNLAIEKDKAIDTLKMELQQILSNEKPSVKGGCYFFDGDDNPYCTGCWDVSMKKIRTARNALMPNLRECPSCKAKFSTLG